MHCNIFRSAAHSRFVDSVLVQPDKVFCLRPLHRSLDYRLIAFESYTCHREPPSTSQSTIKREEAE